MSTPSCPSELRYGALLCYSPDGTSAASRATRTHTLLIKRGAPAHIERIGQRCRECVDDGRLARIFADRPILVPVPRSKPARHPTALWPARRIAEEIAEHGVSAGVELLLERREPVEKSALHRSGALRPGPEDHIRTIAVRGLAFGGQRVVLIDDVVTRGATLLGCAALLQHAFPHLTICAFAAVRTVSGSEVDRMLEPVIGSIRWAGGRLHREP